MNNNSTEIKSDYLRTTINFLIQDLTKEHIEIQNFLSGFQNLNNIELSIILLKLGIFDHIQRSNNEIAEILKLSPESIERYNILIIKKLKNPNHKERVSNYLD